MNVIESTSGLISSLEKCSNRDLVHFVQDNAVGVNVNEKELDYLGFLILMIQTEQRRNQSSERDEFNNILHRIFLVSGLNFTKIVLEGQSLSWTTSAEVTF